ncbi:MAG: adenylosuccinate lyase [bacterium]
MFNYTTYLSTFTHRYGTNAMRTLFSDVMTRKLWRKVWVALAKTQSKYGLVTLEELADLEKSAESIDIEAALKIESEIHHDVMAEIKTYASQCLIGGGKIHLGATSMDVRDNAEVLQQKMALELVKCQLQAILLQLKSLIELHQETVCMGFTHIQPAEPITLGYRFANYAQDFLMDLDEVKRLLTSIRGKGIKGAVGTGASYHQLLEDKGVSLLEFEKEVMDNLSLAVFPVSTQVYPRKQDFLILSVLASICQSAAKFALDLRLLQSPVFGEMAEPFGKKQVGSSAMAFKRNPIVSERICSLARLVPSYAQVAWQDAAQNILERTLDDSANRRTIIPESYLATSEVLRLLGDKILPGLVVNDVAITRNFNTYGIFAGTEPLLMALVEKGENRQEGHEVIRELSLEAWKSIQEGKENPLLQLLEDHSMVKKHFTPSEVCRLTDAKKHVGNVKEKCGKILEEISSSVI